MLGALTPDDPLPRRRKVTQPSFTEEFEHGEFQKPDSEAGEIIFRHCTLCCYLNTTCN